MQRGDMLHIVSVEEPSSGPYPAEVRQRVTKVICTTQRQASMTTGHTFLPFTARRLTPSGLRTCATHGLLTPPQAKTTKTSSWRLLRCGTPCYALTAWCLFAQPPPHLCHSSSPLDPTTSMLGPAASAYRTRDSATPLAPPCGCSCTHDTLPLCTCAECMAHAGGMQDVLVCVRPLNDQKLCLTAPPALRVHLPPFLQHYPRSS